MCLQWLSWLRYHNESDFICYFERFCMFSKGVSWGWNLDSRGFGGSNEINFPGSLSLAMTPSLQHTFNFYPDSEHSLVLSSTLWRRWLMSQRSSNRSSNLRCFLWRLFVYTGCPSKPRKWPMKRLCACYSCYLCLIFIIFIYLFHFHIDWVRSIAQELILPAQWDNITDVGLSV